MRRAVTRIAHEIVERNRGGDGVVLLGLARGGTWLAERLTEVMAGIDGAATPVGVLDVSLHRDVLGLRPVVPSSITGSRARSTIAWWCWSTTSSTPAAPCGRPGRAQRCGGRGRSSRPCSSTAAPRLPIRPDYVGKNLPTRQDEQVQVSPDGVVIGELAPEPASTAAPSEECQMSEQSERMARAAGSGDR